MSRQVAALVRHGEFQRRSDVPSALQPWPLTERGQRQAHAAGAELGQVLRSEGWSLHPDLHCAPQLRTWETAVLIADALADATGLRPDVVETGALAERSLGAAANLTVAEIHSVLSADARHAAPPDDWRSDPFYRLPFQGAESLVEAGRRMADHFDAAIPPGVEDNTAPVLHIFIGHGAAFRHAAHVMGVLDYDRLADLRLPHAQPVLLERDAGGGWQQIAGTWHERSAATFHTRRRRRRASA